MEVSVFHLKNSGNLKTSNGKRKPRRFFLIRLPFAYCANGSLSFVEVTVCKQTKQTKQTKEINKTEQTYPSMVKYVVKKISQFFRHFFLRWRLCGQPGLRSRSRSRSEPKLLAGAGAGAGAGILKFWLRLQLQGKTKVVYLIIIHIK
jgi:hypothetical protein